MFSRIATFLLAVTAMLAVSGPAIAGPADRYSVLSGTQPAGATPETLDLRVSSADGATVEGALAGDQIDGFFAADTREIVWLRSSAGVPKQVFVGSYSENVFARFGRRAATRQREVRGTMFALNTAGGATRQRNAFAFRAWNAFVPQARPPARDRDPAISLTPHPSPQAAWWTAANTQQGATVIEVAADGTLSGFIFGDRIVGHYAADAGTLTFLRLRNGAPIQLFNATSVRRPGAAQLIEFDGTLVALNPLGGASGSGLGFAFDLRNASRFSSIASVFNRLCLEIAGASTNDQARLALGPCMNGGTNQHFSFVNTHLSVAV
ncbi:MAG TPA: hypothetical protein VNT42_00430, partial [Sphingomonas sp.]|nr:hypothetical protein [Sphingomonas sp.]